MAHRVRSLIFAVLAFVVGAGLPLNLTAQDGQSKSATFTVYALGNSPAWKNLHYIGPRKEPVKLVFRAGGRSAALTVEDTSRPLVFVREQVDPATQKKSYLPVAESAWPGAKVQRALLVFAQQPGAGDDAAVRVLAMDDGLAAFPLRTVRVFNASGQNLLGKVAAWEGAVPPGLSGPWPYPVKSEDVNQVGSFPFALAIDAPSTGPRLAHRAQAEAWPLGRLLVFVLPAKSEGGRLVVRMIADAPPSER